jgi:hypothetical protein
MQPPSKPLGMFTFLGEITKKIAVYKIGTFFSLKISQTVLERGNIAK